MKLIAIVLLLLGLTVGCSSPALPTAPTQPILNYPVGTFRLTERSGRVVTDADLMGKVWVGSFVFTRCTGPCPQVTATMARLQSELASEADFRLVTFTVDPTRDDPSELRNYAAHFHANADRWLFLTGDEATIHSLVEKQFKQGVSRKQGADVKQGDEFDHSTRLIVVDRKGIIRRTFPGIRPEREPNADAVFEESLQGLRTLVRELCGQP